MTSRAQSFPAKISNFNNIRSFIESFGQAAGMSRDSCHKLTLMVEELFVNTVRHGHAGDSDEPVDIAVSADDAGITLIYVDTAPKYDSLAAALRTNVETTVGQQRIGGLGLALTFALAQSAQYAYLDGKNRIIIRLPAV